MSEAANPASSASIVAEVIDNGEISRQQLLVVGLCLFFNMLDGFDITAMAVVAGAVSTELQLTPDRLGWIFSFALAGMMVGAMFLAPVSDIIGRRKVIVLSVFLVGASIAIGIGIGLAVGRNEVPEFGAAPVVVGFAALSGLLFSFATPISKLLGESGMGVVTRVMGMILAAIAMGMLADGLKGMLPGLAS